jgi:hypothetical protein
MNPHSLPTLFLTNTSKAYNGEKRSSSINVAGRRDHLPAEN